MAGQTKQTMFVSTVISISDICVIIPGSMVIGKRGKIGKYHLAKNISRRAFLFQ